MARSGPDSIRPPISRSPTPAGALVPAEVRGSRAPPPVLSPAAARAMRHRMLLLRQSAVDHIVRLTGVTETEIRRHHRELVEGPVAETLLRRGAHTPFAREFPHGALLYLIVRSLRPARTIETGVHPGYSSAWILAALDDNRSGELYSLGPGSAQGRARGVGEFSVGQLVAPSLRARWTLVLGNSTDRLTELLDAAPLDLFFYDNGSDPGRARFEMRAAWAALAPRGLLLAHRVDANPAFAEFCRAQGLPPQILDPGPPPIGGLALAR